MKTSVNLGWGGGGGKGGGLIIKYWPEDSLRKPL